MFSEMGNERALLLLGLGTSVVAFFPFYLGVFLLNLNVRKSGTLIIKGLRGNLEDY